MSGKRASPKSGGSGGFTEYGYGGSLGMSGEAKASAVACHSNPVVYCHDGYTCCPGIISQWCNSYQFMEFLTLII